MTVGAGPDGLTYADHALWVANYDAGSVSRVDPARRRLVATIKAGVGTISTSVVGGQIWASNFGGTTITRIDPATDRVLGTLATGIAPVGVVVVKNVAWVLCQGDSTAVLFDAHTGRHLATVQPGVAAGFPALWGGLIWVPDFGDGTNQVIAIDPSTRKIVARVHVGDAPLSVSFAAGSGWVSNTGDSTITRFDPATGRVIGTVPLSGGLLGPLLATPTAVWVSVYGGARLVQLDPPTGRVTRTLAVGSNPQNLVLVGSQLWLAERGPSAVALIKRSWSGQ